jgi:hypothetical protein
MDNVTICREFITENPQGFFYADIEENETIVYGVLNNAKVLLFTIKEDHETAYEIYTQTLQKV